MQTTDPRTQMRAFQRAREAMAARLRQIDDDLSAWDADELAGPGPQPSQLIATRPALSRPALKSLQQALLGVMGELQDTWERRN
jgi:hypothetical protein